MSQLQDALVTIGSKNNPLVISLSEYKGRRIVDIRKYYTDKDSKELVPTKKGLSLTLGTFNALEEIAYGYGAKIKQWLQGVTPCHHALIDRSEAEELVATTYQEYLIAFDSWRSHKFFEVKNDGNVNTVTFNIHHPYVINVRSKSNAEELFRTIASIIVTFKRASYRFDDLDFNHDAFFDSLESEWGCILKSYTKEG